jgi:cell wall-associated NlpC family hydrolase
MRKAFKITNSAVIYSILLTFLLSGLVSCKSSKKSSSSPSRELKSASPREKGEDSPNKKVVKVIEEARSYTGTKYKFGGVTRNGMDCSGLMYTAFQAVNITLPRTSTEQSKLGKTVSLDDIKPGDLVFFTDRKGHSKVTHVGLVTEVKGNKNIKFIHASTKLGVVEDNLFADYYISVFIKATRAL